MKISLSRIKRVKEIFLEWSLNSDLNCYTKIFVYRQRPVVAIIWLLILLSSSGITFWLITRSIQDYLNYLVVSQIGIAYEIKSSLFPTVTICDNNPFSTQQAQNMFEEVENTYNVSPTNSNFLLYTKLYVNSIDYDDEKRKSYGLNLSQIRCKFANRPCDMKTDMNRIWMYEYGNCWQFNSGRNKNSTLKETYNGVEFGLELTVSLDIQNKYVWKETLFQGLIVFIHNNSFSPLRTEKSQAFVEMGKKTFIGVKRVFNYKMAYPYSECFDLTNFKSDLYDLIIANSTYRQEDCLRLCRQKLYNAKCGCNLLNGDFNNVNSNLKSCGIFDSNCIEKQYYNYSREECEVNSCPLECNSIEYDLSLSSLSYSHYNSTVVLAVYYPSLEYTFIRESPQMTKLDLFANIGGTLGLFISASIFTLFEIIEIFFLVLEALLF